MPYVELPITSVPLSELALDLENYRIPTRRDDEAGALSYLFASEDAMSAARLILRDGYFDNEVPIAVVESSQFIVLEGNRRVSALKALRDPSIIPQFETEIRGLLKRYAIEAENLPERIRVLIAPDRSTAAPHIARLHTGIPKKRWSRDQQATFYYSLLDASTTVDDVKAIYPDVDVVRFVKMAVMRRLLAAVPFKRRSFRAYAASDKLKMSVFEYAYRNKDVAATIGATFDGDGFLQPTAWTPEKIGRRLPPGNVRALEYLLEQFEKDHLNTRSPEFQRKTQEHADLLERLQHLSTLDPSDADKRDSNASDQSEGGRTAAASSGRGSGGSGDHPNSGSGRESDRAAGPEREKSEPEAKSEKEKSNSRGPNHPNTKDKLDLSGVDYESAQVNLKLRYQELRKVNLNDLPISAAILLRSILEATIKVHFEGTPTPARGELREVFRLVEATYGKDKALQAAIQHVKSGGSNKAGSISWFNLVAHSADAAVTADEVRGAWSRINPLIRRLLRPA